MVLSQDQFEREGFLSPLPVLSPAEADAVRAEFDRLESREGQERAGIGLIDRHFEEPFVMALATHPRIVAAITARLGTGAQLLATHFFCKYPKADSDPADRYVAWHQDVTYWGLEPPMAVTAWYAVDDSDVENGCMRVIPGTHAAIREHGTADRPGNLLSINQEVPVTPEEEAGAVDLVLRAGEISLHHGMLVHGSNPNHSSRRRCGLTLRYVPAGVRQVASNSQGYRYRPLPLDPPTCGEVELQVRRQDQSNA
jgi:non-haem Fe2+, alpha-ketoglutarate-dependent halogenase